MESLEPVPVEEWGHWIADQRSRQAAIRIRPDWDDYFLDVAFAVSSRADCRRRAVGTVVVDSDHRIIATGYNGAPAGEPGCLSGACPRGLMPDAEARANRDYDQCIAVHSEANAIIHARVSCKGATLYCTKDPCIGCIKLIKAAGIVRVVTPNSDIIYS